MSQLKCIIGIEVRNSRIEKKGCLYASVLSVVSQTNQPMYEISEVAPPSHYRPQNTFHRPGRIFNRLTPGPASALPDTIHNELPRTLALPIQEATFLLASLTIYRRVNSFDPVTQPCLVSSSASTRRPTAASSRHPPFVPPSRLGPPRHASLPKSKKSSKGYRRPQRVPSQHRVRHRK